MCCSLRLKALVQRVQAVLAQAPVRLVPVLQERARQVLAPASVLPAQSRALLPQQAWPLRLRAAGTTPAPECHAQIELRKGWPLPPFFRLRDVL